MQAILFVGHGTRNETGRQQFLRLAEHLRAAVAPLPLEVAYIELQSPAIDDALVRMYEQGYKNITLSPALLFAAGHLKQDIPAAVAAATQKFADLEVILAEPLGCHEALIELAAHRFLDSLSPVPRGKGRSEGPDQQQDAAITKTAKVRTADPTKTALVLVGRGSSDPEAIAHCRLFAQLLAERVGVQNVFTGFLAIAPPSVSEALEQAIASGAQRIVVQPHLLFDGEMLNATANLVTEFRKTRPELDWRLAEILGSDLLGDNKLAAKYLIRALRQRLTLMR